MRRGLISDFDKLSAAICRLPRGNAVALRFGASARYCPAMAYSQACALPRWLAAPRRAAARGWSQACMTARQFDHLDALVQRRTVGMVCSRVPGADREDRGKGLRRRHAHLGSDNPPSQRGIPSSSSVPSPSLTSFTVTDRPPPPARGLDHMQQTVRPCTVYPDTPRSR